MRKLILTAIMLFCLSMNNSIAQTVERKGNNFTQVSNKKKPSKETKTEYTFTDSKGKVYPIYLSSTGKAFIKKTNKKGEEYKKYMPEIGKQINPKAYKEVKK